MVQICTKRSFVIENEKSKHHYRLCMFELVSALNNFDFLDQIYPKKIFLFENRKSELQHWIAHVRIIAVTEFQLKVIISTFLTKFAQKQYFSSKETSELHCWVLHIRISLGTKFPLKLIILTFWKKFPQKVHFQSKIKKVNLII